MVRRNLRNSVCVATLNGDERSYPREIPRGRMASVRMGVTNGYSSEGNRLQRYEKTLHRILRW